MRRFFLQAVLLVVTSFVMAHAEDATPPQPPAAEHKLPTPEQKTLESFGAANASCHEWSDGCAVCMRQGDGTMACSLPGIACEPVAVTCSPETPKSEPAPPAGTPPTPASPDTLDRKPTKPLSPAPSETAPAKP